MKTAIITQLSAVNEAATDLTTGTITTELGRITANFADGSGLNQANRSFAAAETLASSASSTLDLYDFGGLKSPDGNLYALSKIKALAVRNKSLDPTAILRVGGEGSTAAWMAVNGEDEAYIADIAPGGQLFLIAPSAAGYAVADTTNHLLKLENLSATVVLNYELVVIGA